MRLYKVKDLSQYYMVFFSLQHNFLALTQQHRSGTIMHFIVTHLGCVCSNNKSVSHSAAEFHSKEDILGRWYGLWVVVFGGGFVGSSTSSDCSIMLASTCR